MLKGDEERKGWPGIYEKRKTKRNQMKTKGIQSEICTWNAYSSASKLVSIIEDAE